MQFFDRPQRAKIALGRSSARQATSDELLARARRARDSRRHRRLQHTSAAVVQAAWRRRAAAARVAAHLLRPPPARPADPVAAFLLAAGVLARSPPTHAPADTLRFVREHVRRRPVLPSFLPPLAEALGPAPHPHPHHLQDATQPMRVKTCVVLLALAEHHLQPSTRTPTPAASAPSPASVPESALSLASSLASTLDASAVPHLVDWGFADHLAAVLARHLTLHASHPPPPSLLPLTRAMSRLLALDDAPRAHDLRAHLGSALLAVDRVLPLVPWLRAPAVVTRVMRAMAAPTTSEPIAAVEHHHHFSNLRPAEAAVTLSNVLELGDNFLRTSDKDALWSFIAVLSTLIEAMPQQMVLMHDNTDFDSDDDDDIHLMDIEVEQQQQDRQRPSVVDSQAMREVMRRLSASLKQIVSEDTVRLLLSAAVAEGRTAVVRVCQLFNFLTRREKSLNMAFQNALAFWRGSRAAPKPHILSSLWALCLKGGDADGDTDSMADSSSSLDMNSSPLRPEATPILLVFASAYSYLLYIQDEEEMFDARWPFAVEEVRDIVLALKHYLFAALYVKPTGVTSVRGPSQVANFLRKEPGLLEEVSRLLSRLYLCDSRREFRTSDDFWRAGRGSLASDSFLQDAVDAGPEALVQAPEVTSFGGVRQVSYNTTRKSAVSGAGELLRVAPYLVPFSSRAKIFQSWIARERDLANGGQSFFPSAGRSVAVRRKFIFEDAFEELNGMGPELKATIRVKFIDEHGIEEAGIDGGGVFKEFMYEVLKLGFSPFSYGLFKATPDGRLYPNPDAPIANESFKVQFAFLGRLLGKAVFDGVLVDIPLARFFLSKILGQFNYPTDLGSLDPQLYKNMKYLKNCPPDVVEDLGLNFTAANNAFGTSNEVELVRNGKNISVTASNRIEYMHRVANYRMNTQIREQSDAFLKGFSEIISPQYIRLFSHEELQLLISGKTGKIDLDDLRRHTKYSGGYDEDTLVIKWFWQAMSEMSGEDQSKLLQFVTSSPRAPLLGFSYLVPGFCIHRAEGHVRLPTASTCMNLLKLPQYQSLDVVRDKLRYALQSNAGFDLS